MIRYLEEDEKTAVRIMWEEIFTEDSQSFVDYYFKEKTKNNQILVSEEDGKLVSMLHRNPYRVAVRDRVWDADYIVGVATLPDYRHQGRMRDLLISMISDMYREKMEFCFLMPAAEAIYRPFDFRYVFAQPQWKLNKTGKNCLDSKSCSDGDYQLAADFVNARLAAEYEVYSVRDEEYIRSLCMEVQSDGGELLLLFDSEVKDELAGIYAYYQEGEQKLRELICIPKYREEAALLKPAIMARIVNLAGFVKPICLKESCEQEHLELILEVVDPLIEENNGAFLWTLDKHGSKLTRQDAADNGKAQLCMNIGELTAWLFGYQKSETVWAQYIHTLDGVFLDEIV